MKKIYLFLLGVFLSHWLHAQSYNYFGTFNSSGVPNYLTTSDVIPQAFLNNIQASLPENYPVPTYHPQYIATGNTTEISITETADVWITFVDEGAGYRNVLGFYTYQASNPPSSVSAINNLKIIFPNVSKVNSGGGLQPGNKVYLGTFNAGTVISWFLIADGFRNGAVTTGNWRLFSNPNFNPESNTSLRNHTVLLYDTTYKKVVIGFEDIRRDNSSCDNDFNDALFYVQSNPITAMATTQMVKTVNTSTNTSSGNSGGLESNNSLSDLVTRRYFNQMLQGHSSTMEVTPNFKSRGTLERFIPDLSSKNLKAITTTPSDLVTVTNAQEVYSVDYFDSVQSRTAVIFSTFTQQGIYNHTKAICDRLNGAVLESVQQETIAGYPLITYRLLHENGEREYVSCFSLEETIDSLKLHCHWLISDYPKEGSFYNYQIWSKYPHTLQFVMDELFKKAQLYKPLALTSNTSNIPEVYILRGERTSQGLDLTIVNNTSETEATFQMVYRKTETEASQTFNQKITLLPQQWNTVSIPFSSLFDADIQCMINNKTIDAVYLADGAWGIDANPIYTEIQSFEVSETPLHDTTQRFTVHRTAKLQARSESNVNLFRILQSGNRAMDLSDYSYLNLCIQNNEALHIRLASDEIKNWADQAHYYLNKTGSNQVSIPISAFHANGNAHANMKKIQHLTLSAECSDHTMRDILLQVNEAFFSKQAAYDIVDTLFHEFEIYPNPSASKGALQMRFVANTSEQALCSVYSLQGALIHSQYIDVQAGTNELSLTLPELRSGTYTILVKLSKGLQSSKFSIP